MNNKYKGAYQNKKNNANKRGITFALTYEEYYQMRTNGTCAYTGVTLNRVYKSRYNDFTLERIDSTKGYIKGNVLPVSDFANNLKSRFEHNGDDITIMDLIRFIVNTNKHTLITKLYFMKQAIISKCIELSVVANNIPVY